MLSSTEKNQLRRINRMLRSEYEVIRHPREGSRTERELGRFYRTDVWRNAVVDWNVDLDECERELRQDRLEGVMQAQHERLERATAEILRRAQGRRISVNH